MDIRQQKKADSFGTFLTALKRREEASEKDARDPGRLLATLAESGPVAMAELMARGGLGFAEFAETIGALEEAGLVSLTGDPGQEMVQLTSKGARLAQLAR